jgi:hypothetical protein
MQTLEQITSDSGANGATRSAVPVADRVRVGIWQAKERGGNCSRSHQFDREVITRCVRPYPRFELSLRNLMEMIAERGLAMTQTTIMRGAGTPQE